MLVHVTNGQIDTFNAAFRVMRHGIASRKLVVVGDCSDMRGSPRQRWRYLAENVASFADIAIFVGDHSYHGMRYAVRFGMRDEHVRNFVDVRAASEFLRTQLMPGDLVLSKGRNSQRLGRLLFLLNGAIACDLVTCRRKGACDDCPKLDFSPTNTIGKKEF